MLPVVEVLTWRSPIWVVQLTLNVVWAVPSDGTFTVRGFAPLTVQLLATPVSWTLWLPSARPLKVTWPLIPIVWLCVPSTVAV